MLSSPLWIQQFERREGLLEAEGLRAKYFERLLRSHDRRAADAENCGALMPRTLTSCPYLRPSVVIGSAVAASSIAIRSGTIARTLSPSRATRCSFWNWILSCRPAQVLVPSTVTEPRAQPAFVSRSRSTVLPSKRTRQCW